MAYIGRPLNAGNLAVQSGTGDGSDTTPIATLDYSVGSSNSIAVYLDGVRQLAGTDFTAAGTTLTFTTAPANLVGIDVYFLGLELSIPTPADASVSTAKIVDDAVTLAKMAPGTDGNLITYDASGNPAAVATGSAGQVLTSAGAGSPPTFAAAAGITLGTPVASTSGTAIGFTSIPAGTKRITLTVNDVSIDAATQYWIQIGDSGGYETSGYLGSGVRHSDGSINTITTGFLGQNPSATPEYSGQTILTLANSSSNTWTCMGIWGADTAEMMVTGGRKSLSGVLDRIQITTGSGSANFNSGEVNISYE